MAATNVQSGDGGINSPTSQRGVSSSPWSQIVRRGGGGGESEVISPVVVATVGSAPASPSRSSVQEHVGNSSPDWSPSKVVQEAVSSPDDSGTEGQPDSSDNSGGNSASKKPVWNTPSKSNGVVEVVSPVMGTAWPALGESTKASLKSSSSESLKALSDGPWPPALQATGNSSSPHKQSSANNANSTSPPNHVAPTRQRSMKRGGGNSTANGVVSQPPPPPPSQDSVETQTPNDASGKPGLVADQQQPSPRDHTVTHKDSQKGGFGSQPHSGNDHNHHRGSFRRGNGGQHNHNYGGKRDHDRGNNHQEWNQHSRSFNNRDSHVQSPRGFSRGGGYMRPSVHTSAPFISPQMPVQVQPFGNNMMYPDPTSPVIYVPYAPPPESLRGMPFVTPLAPSMYFAVPDPQLHAKIVTQIDYYFSNENLVRDTYLRRNMDEQGWVPASLIAGFKKVSYLTDNIQLILDAMRTSTVVEVQGEKIRRRNDWMKWMMPVGGPSSPQAAVGRSSNDNEELVSQLQGVHLATSQEKFTTHGGSMA
ncbi:la-related protein 1C [Lactuca sativa]|uniref:HTH La-type RNA-binding domain-containing protein n=1 Tax=Lactuca sativa TaxID=4236 RepID=A0A9R1WH52_LACSA|nr:la-related protein 1C [Lactuca sativa]KAJ0223798.1 hypothetical protein LSAT_V11C200077560 [Lactuca sativa]